MGRNYQDAIAALNTLQSNYATVKAVRTSGQNKEAIPEMVEWCRRAGYEPADFDPLNAIHIAGTKGKGSTSAFISSILSQYGQSRRIIRKTGLYTSPHLRSVRERIKINDEPLSEEAFARHFFSVWDRLEEAARKAGLPTDVSSKPAYFKYLTLMAFQTYLEEGVDTAVIETGIGGEYDSTNILLHPTAVGITSLGIDHAALLGNTIEEIAWQKAGIMKPGALAFTVPQPAGAMEVLQRRAEEKGVTLEVVQRHPEIDKIPLGLAGDFQKTNASLAIVIAASHLHRLGYEDIPADITTAQLPGPFRLGLRHVQFEGRCQIISELDNKTTWYIDGAHTAESVALAGKWYATQQESAPSSKRILIFNQQTRDAPSLARTLHQTLQDALKAHRPFSHVLFCTNVTFKSAGYKPDLVSMNANDRDVEDVTVQNDLARAWREIEGEEDVHAKGSLARPTDVRVTRTIEEAVEVVRALARDEVENGKELKVLVTGSLHLVGGLLEVLDVDRID
ncbi:MAG: Folylpolyglutamate synthetase [Peltula sp. TS41687]|nr:MAG: Folylpolyglutamate synthetase [Peltula sp. TS41687]